MKKAVSIDIPDVVFPDFDFPDGEFPIDSITGTEHLSPLPPEPTALRSVRAKRVLLADSTSPKHNEFEMRERKSSDAITPGGVIDSAVPKMLEHCCADERKTFMPFFLPGRILHLQVKKNSR